MGFRIFSRLFERKSLASPDADLLELFGASQSTASGVCITAESALRAISEAIATSPAHVVRKNDAGECEPDPSHPANALLTGEWNAWTSAYDGMLALVIDALTQDRGGIAWVNRVNGRPIEIVRYL